GLRVAKNQPDAGPVDIVVTGTYRAGELDQFKVRRVLVCEIKFVGFGRAGLNRGMSKKFHQHSASVVNEVAKTLTHEDGVHVARSGLLQIMEVVIGERLGERDFDGGGRLILIRNDADGHSV